MPKKKLSPKTNVSFRAYPIIEDKVCLSVASGLRRVNKHADKPLSDTEVQRILAVITDEVMNGLGEIIDFGDNPSH